MLKLFKPPAGVSLPTIGMIVPWWDGGKFQAATRIKGNVYFIGLYHAENPNYRCRVAHI